ncbi:hypothetical protein B566_EDAN013934 [Ephemera danica]|nr:hypothetical protein B566_EDAN013934 [Ephemera danica]
MFNMTPSEEGIPALHGLRAFGMAWIVLLHYAVCLMIFGENPNFRRNAEKNLIFPILANGHIVVDTFFFIRLTLPYTFTILLVMVTFRLLNAHSEFETSTPDIENCAKFWWRNFAYINNLYEKKELCLSWSWYLSADTQLYILSAPLLLLFVNGYRRTSIALSVLILVASWIATAAISFSIGNVPSVQNPFGSFELIYSKPWSHLGAVWVGLYTGWMVQRGSFKVGKIGLILGWTTSISGLLFTLFVVHWGEVFNVTNGAAYEALKSTVWASGFAWILLVCVYKKAGWIGDFIELPFFAPFSRATYCTYLLHYPLMEWVFITLHGPLPINVGLSVIVATGLIVTSNILGVITSLLLESPVFSLLDLVRHVNVGDRKCQQCLRWSWYLSADMQLYVLAVPILLLFANGWSWYLSVDMQLYVLSAPILLPFANGVRWLLLFAVTSLVSGDPDLRQLLHIWRPTSALTWSHVTPECAQAMEDYSLALSQRQQWASSMLDATGQASPQFLQNANYWLGSRTQCEQVNEDFNSTNIDGLEISIAVYRVLKLKIDVTEPLKAPKLAIRIVKHSIPRHIWMGVCVPGACGDAAQVSALLRQMLDAAQSESNFRNVQLVHVKILPIVISPSGEKRPLHY